MPNSLVARRGNNAAKPKPALRNAPVYALCNAA